MVRGSVNGLGQGLHLDVTTTGALCISSLPKASHGERGVLRLHDVTTPCPRCGKTGVIVGNLMPYMKYEGLPVAVHGAQIRCGCPPGTNKLIAPLERPYGARTEPASAVRADSASAIDTQSVNPGSANKTAVPMAGSNEKTSAVVCDHPDQLEEPARYIAHEMNRNLLHPTVAKIKNLLSYDPAEARYQWLEQPWYTKLRGMPNFHGVAMGNQAAAAALWAKMVGQDRPWDHKPKLKALFNNVVWHKYGKYAYFFDIWSNVHYGYIGIACGFSEDWLFDGAGLEQIASDTLRKINDWQEKPGPRRSEGVEGLRAWDDLPDRISIFIGIKLYRKYPRGGLTPAIIMDEILSVPIADWGEGVRLHSCYDKQKQVST
jgi:uncharacterized Zn-binding protein involved in type VI secretion